MYGVDTRMPKHIQARQILLPAKGGDDNRNLFGIKYSMNCYRGCQHQCIYCDTRSDCYQILHFDEIEVKTNAVDLLRKELYSKKRKETVGTGSMNDPYMPIESGEKLTQKALEVLYEFRFPVHVMTKSSLVLRDKDILKDLSSVYAAVTFTITTPDDVLYRMIEPHAPESSQRFKAMKILASEGILTGVSMMPVLPWITDDWIQVQRLVKKAKDCGASYILNAGMGMTLRQGQREYFYNELDKIFPGLRKQYEKNFGNKYYAYINQAELMYRNFEELCDKLGIALQIPAFGKLSPEQEILF
jgi:DNA repair photolyase